MNNCLYIVRDDVTLKDIKFIFIYHELLKIFLRINLIDYTSMSQCNARKIYPDSLTSFQCYLRRNERYFIHRQVRLPRFPNKCNECNERNVTNVTSVTPQNYENMVKWLYTQFVKLIAVTFLTRTATAKFKGSANTRTCSLLLLPQSFQPGSVTTVRFTLKNVLSC